jgi:hypothetical protein
MNVLVVDELLDAIHAIEEDTPRLGDVDAILGAAMFIGARLERIAVVLERIAEMQKSLIQTAIVIPADSIGKR